MVSEMYNQLLAFGGPSQWLTVLVAGLAQLHIDLGARDSWPRQTDEIKPPLDPIFAASNSDLLRNHTREGQRSG